MKKFICIVLTLGVLLCAASCSKTENPATGTDASTQSGSDNADVITTAAPITNAPGYSNGMEETFDQIEYAAYVDLFYNQNSKDYADKEYTKEGTFGSIIDCYNDGMTRYYVWGYADSTKCCDYQWEFVAPKGWKAPEKGSKITVKGTLKANDKALDGYWLEDCEITVEKEYNQSKVDYDLTTISPTLARVQIASMVTFNDQFDGKTVKVFGRTLASRSIQHPYYDNAWSIDFVYDGAELPIGQYIVLNGTFNAGENGGSLINASDVITVD